MRLLLVEDERSLSRAVKAVLEKNKYSVYAEFDGEEEFPVRLPPLGAVGGVDVGLQLLCFHGVRAT